MMFKRSGAALKTLLMETLLMQRESDNVTEERFKHVAQEDK